MTNIKAIRPKIDTELIKFGDELKAEIAELKKDAERIKAAFYVNMLRCFPEKTHDEIADAINAAIEAEGRKE